MNTTPKIFTMVLAILLAYSCNLLAAPNLWAVGSLQGYVEYGISNEHNDVVSIACNEAAGEDRDHSVTFTSHNGQEYPSDKYSIEFVINDESYIVPESSMTRSHAGQWDNFISAISKATAFDVYINNKKAATFNPRPKNVQKALSDIRCHSLW